MPRSHENQNPGFSRDPALPSYEDDQGQFSRRQRIQRSITTAPGRLIGWTRQLPARTDYYRDGERTWRIDNLADDIASYAADETPTVLHDAESQENPGRKKERSGHVEMLSNSINYAIHEAGATARLGSDGKYHLERSVTFGSGIRPHEYAIDQPNSSAMQNATNRTYGVFGRKITNETIEAHLWDALHGAIESLNDGVDMEQWGQIIHPASVKELRKRWIQSRVMMGASREAVTKHIQYSGMGGLAHSPDIVSDYFGIDFEHYLQEGNSRKVPDKVYSAVNFLLQQSDANLDILAEVAGPAPTPNSDNDNEAGNATPPAQAPTEQAAALADNTSAANPEDSETSTSDQLMQDLAHTYVAHQERERLLAQRREANRRRVPRPKGLTSAQMHELMDFDRNVGETIAREAYDEAQKHGETTLPDDVFPSFASDVRERLYRERFGEELTPEQLEAYYGIVMHVREYLKSIGKDPDIDN